MKHLLFIILMACSISVLMAQTAPVIPPAATLNDQYKNLKTDLEVVNGFRMIKMYTMDRFWKTVEDTVQAQKVKYRSAATEIAGLQKEIAAQQASLRQIQQDNQLLETKVDNMVVFGKAYSKTGVVLVGSFVILGLVVLSVVLFIVSRASYHTSRELRKLNESMYQEFDTYKRHAVEKEIKISRELQNYRNRLAELKLV